MGKFSGMLLVSDYDNTFQYKESALTAGGKDSVPALQPQNLRAVNRWIAGGGLFAIATARALGAFRKFAEQIPINAPLSWTTEAGFTTCPQSSTSFENCCRKARWMI